MLYDILSPLIFFLSLGGILLIVGRVVIRIRREQLSTSIRSVGAATPPVSSTLWQTSGREVSQLLRPTQKSVHAMRSRFALFTQMITQTKGTLTGWRARRQAAKQAPATATSTPPPASPVAPEFPEATGITQPTRRGLRGRLRSWRGRTRPQTTVVPATVVPDITQESMVGEPAVLPETKATRPAITVTHVSSATPAVTPAPEVQENKSEPVIAAPVTQPAVAQEPSPRNFASSLLRRVQAKRRRVQPEALQSAESELENQHFQAAEDVLVPYIVKHPKDTAAYMLLGQAAMGREAWEEAMEIFEQVIKWSRKQEGAYAGLGLSAYRAGKFTRALQALQRAQDTDPDNLEVLEALLSIAEKMDNPALQHSIREKIDARAAREEQQKNVQANASV